MRRRSFLARGTAVAASAAVAAPWLPAQAAGAPLLVGQSAPLSGSQAGFGASIRDGLQLAFKAANAAGGVGGRPVNLLTLDDAGERSRTEANVAQLSANRQVAALTGFVSRPCSEGAALAAAKEGIAIVGAFSGAPLIYTDQAPTTFLARASYERELEAIVRHYRQLGAQKFGFVFLEDGRATNVPLFEGVVTKAGGQMVVAPAIDRRGPAMNAAAIKQLDAAKPDAVVFLTNNAPLTPLLREYAPRTLALPKVVVSFVDREQLLADLGKDAAGVGFSVVVPEYTREKFSVVRDFQQAARENKVAPSPVSLEGFIMGQVLLEGLRRARGDSRAQVIEAMAGLNVDLGYTQLRFTRQERAGSRYVDLSLAARGGIV